MKATAAAGTLTTSIRGLPKDQSMTPDPTLYKNWTDGTIVYVTVLAQNYATLQDENAWTGLNSFAAASTFNALVTINAGLIVAGTTSYIKFPNLTTVQRLALTPSNGFMVYDTNLGLFYQYKGGAWASVDTGTTAPNASTTVAGIVELPTQGEFDAGTAVGGTGASLVATPPLVQNMINTATAKTTAVDADALVIADSAAAGINKKITLANFKASVGIGNTFTL